MVFHNQLPDNSRLAKKKEGPRYFYVPECCCVLLLCVVVCCCVFLCVVVCCCVLEGWGGRLVAMLCKQVFRGRGLVGRGPAPPPTIM
jgi:hypothetical protein